MCKRRCPRYIPKWTVSLLSGTRYVSSAPLTQRKPCSTKSIQAPHPTFSSELSLSPCVCDDIMCVQSWPESCHCANNAVQQCYDRCGGEKPILQSCQQIDEVEPASKPAETCSCEMVQCIQLWPDSCYCANAAAERCHKKCGGERPKPQVWFLNLPLRG